MSLYVIYALAYLYRGVLPAAHRIHKTIRTRRPTMSLRRSDDPLDTYLLRVFVLLITERSV